MLKEFLKIKVVKWRARTIAPTITLAWVWWTTVIALIVDCHYTAQSILAILLLTRTKSSAITLMGQMLRRTHRFSIFKVDRINRSLWTMIIKMVLPFNRMVMPTVCRNSSHQPFRNLATVNKIKVNLVIFKKTQKVTNKIKRMLFWHLMESISLTSPTLIATSRSQLSLTLSQILRVKRMSPISRISWDRYSSRTRWTCQASWVSLKASLRILI